jgi:CIC family chloride channel protein
MAEREPTRASTTEGLPVAPSMGPALVLADTPRRGSGVDASGALLGVLTRRNLLDAESPDTATVRGLLERPPVVVYEDESLREAADRMVIAGVGRLPVIDRSGSARPVGIITRSDLLAAHLHRIDAARRPVRSLGAR